MLAHVRPLLSAAPQLVDDVAPDELVRSLESLMREHGVRGAVLDFACEEGLPALKVDREVLHHMLQSLLFAALEATSAKGMVAVRARLQDDLVAFEIEDDGEVDEDPAAWREQMRRGRPLLCAVAQNVLQKRGGRVEAARDEGLTRVALLLPPT
jgi:K+-sensing histidine kinase KdpD